MALTGLRPSQLDAETIAALQTKLEIPVSTVTGDDASTMMYGQGLANIRRKLRTMISTFGKPESSIRITLFADSIFASSSMKQDLIDYFNDTWGIPEANIDVNCCFGGYEITSYLPALDSAVIKPNVDLFIFSDVPFPEIRDQMVALVRQKTNADIMVGSWTINPAVGYPRYNYCIDTAKKYQCELLDINGLLLRKYADGDLTPLLAGESSVHLSISGADYIFADLVKHFESSRYYNEYVSPDSIREEVIHLGAEKMIPVFGVTFSGTWEVQGTYPLTTKGNMVRSSTATDYIEFTFTGIGFEILFAANVAENIHNVLLDSDVPSAYATNILEYCTQIIGKTQTEVNWHTHRLFAAQVTAPFMANDEDEVEFEITIGTPVRVDGVLTELPYTLRQGVDVLGTGDIFTDATFVFRTTGEITIPALVYGVPNYLEWGTTYLFNAGDTMQFFARKTWKDSIDTNNETFLRVAGLARASHTVRITKASAVASDLKYLSLYK